MQPNHDRPFGMIMDVRCKYIEDETILADRQVGKGQHGPHFAGHIDGRLRTTITHLVGLLDAAPGRRRFGRKKAILAAGIGAVVDTQERVGALGGLTLQLALLGLHNEVRTQRRRRRPYADRRCNKARRAQLNPCFPVH